MSRRKTHEEFVIEMKEFNPNIEIIGKYTLSKNKVLCNCLICNNKWESRASHLLKGCGCPKCSKGMRTHDEFITELKDINPNVEILGVYKKADEKIKSRCLICGHEWNPKAISLLEGHGCPKCARIFSRKNPEQFVKEVNAIRPDIKIRSKYVTMYDKVECECSFGHIWSTYPQNPLEGHGCPICAHIKSGKSQAYTQEEFEAQVFEKNPYIKIDGKYKNQTTRVSCHCIFCGNKFTIKPTSKRLFCPMCSDGISYPNKFLRSFLMQLNIEDLHFEWQPEWAKPYYYDSYFCFNNKKYIIEMDGGFHYDQTFGEQTPEKVTKRDRIKEKLAKEHNITVIRIDCRKSEKEYISNNILKSNLSILFNLSNIDWNMCHEESLNSLMKIACDMFSNDLTITEIAKELKCSYSTIINYLKLGSELSWCIYPKPKKKIEVCQKDTNNMIGIFEDINKCIDYMNTTFNKNFKKYCVYNTCIDKNRKSYKGFIFKYVS